MALVYGEYVESFLWRIPLSSHSTITKQRTGRVRWELVQVLVEFTTGRRSCKYLYCTVQVSSKNASMMCEAVFCKDVFLLRNTAAVDSTGILVQKATPYVFKRYETIHNEVACCMSCCIILVLVLVQVQHS